MIKPLFKNVLIDIHKMDESIFLMVDENEAKLEQATVLSIGDEVQSVNIGDVIAFKAYNLDTIDLRGKQYNLIPEDDIKGIIMEDETPA